MGKRDFVASLYLVNAVVLIAHEIDSAYWHEWELLTLPGGIQLFVILNMVLIGVVLWGYRSVILWTHRARSYSYLLAVLGIFAALLHGALLASGAPEFRLPTSVALIFATFVISVWQLIVTARIPKGSGRHHW